MISLLLTILLGSTRILYHSLAIITGIIGTHRIIDNYFAFSLYVYNLDHNIIKIN